MSTWIELTDDNMPLSGRSVEVVVMPSRSVLPGFTVANLYRYLALYGPTDEIQWRYPDTTA